MANDSNNLRDVNGLLDYDPLSREQNRDPYPVYERMRAECPVFDAERFGLVVITRYDDVLAGLVDAETFSSATPKTGMGEMAPSAQAVYDSCPVPPATLVTLDPPDQTNNKRPVQRALSARRVHALEPRVVEIVGDLLAKFAGRGSVEFVSEFGRTLPVTVVATLLGFPIEEHGNFERWSNDLASGLSASLTEEEQLRVATSSVELRTRLQEMIDERRTRPEGDLLSDLMAATRPDDTKFSDQELIGLFEQFVTAGYETTANLLSGMFLVLATHPELAGALLEDPGKIDNFIDESLRIASPVQGRYRVTTRDVEVSGTTIPSGQRTQLMLGSANHDPEMFPEPEEFRLGRENADKHLAFGWGAHVCLGAEIARVEARTALRLLLPAMPNLRLSGGRDLTWLKHFHLRGLERLDLEFDVT